MHEYVLTLLAAAAVTYLLTPLVRLFAIRVGALHAARDRDVHVAPTPLLGGFAMYAGLAAGLLVASRLPELSGAFVDNNMAKGLLLAGGLIVVMGFVDDRWGMGAVSKLAGQVAAGVILVWSGAAITWLPGPNRMILGLTADQGTALTILVVVVTINAVNFIDGLDGLAAGIVGIGAAAFFAYYFTLTHRLNLADQTGPALASAVLTGVCLGFLPHNFHRAKIFMGDTGSMLIGLLLAYAPISSLAALDPYSLTDQAAYAGGTVNRFGTILPLLLPAAILLIPYADLAMAVVRRTRAGLSPFAADRKHLHHRLLDIGHSHRRSVLILYLWAALFAGSVTGLSIVRTPLVVLAGVTAGGMLALLLVSMPRLRWWARSRQPVTGMAAVQPRISAQSPASAQPPARVQPPASAQSPAGPVRPGAGLPDAGAPPVPVRHGAGARHAESIPDSLREDSPSWLAEAAPPGQPAQPEFEEPSPPVIPAAGFQVGRGRPPVPPAWQSRGPGG